MSKRLVIVAYGLNTPSLVEKARAVSPDFEVVYLPVQLPPDALRTYASGKAAASPSRAKPGGKTSRVPAKKTPPQNSAPSYNHANSTATPSAG